jgi:hypothetical protein
MNQQNAEIRYQIIASSRLSPCRKKCALFALGRMFNHAEAIIRTREERVAIRQAAAKRLSESFDLTGLMPPTVVQFPLPFMLGKLPSVEPQQDPPSAANF